MKKLIYVCVIALMMVFATNHVTIVMAAPPMYRQPLFYSIDDLIYWIETTDAENFQGGRFRNCLASLRARGEIFIPYVDDDATLVSISALPTHSQAGLIHDGMMLITFTFSTPNDFFTVRVAEINPIRIPAYEAGGVMGYSMAVFGERDANVVVRERAVPFRDVTTGEITEKSAQYVLVDSFTARPYYTGGFVTFVIQGMELQVVYRNIESKTYFHNLSWETTPITPRGAGTIPIPPPPPIIERPQPDMSPRTVRFTIGSTEYTVNGIPHTSDVAPFIDPAYSRTMIPLRAVSVALGAVVDWNEPTRSALIGVHAEPIGIMHRVMVDHPLPYDMGMPVIYKDRIFVPLRFVAELLGATPRWDGANSAAYVYINFTHE